MWPYDRDLLLGPLWQIEDNVPSKPVEGSIGMYVDATSIDTLEIIDYTSVLNAAMAQPGQGAPKIDA